MITLSFNRLSFHLIWIFGLLEMITVPLVAGLPRIVPLAAKSPLQGALVGFLGMVVLFVILNRFIGRLHLKLGDNTVTRISVLPLAVWNTLLLALIFGIQKLTGLMAWNSYIIQSFLAGFISVAGAVLITLFLYQIVCTKMACLSISLQAGEQKYSVRSVSVFSFALLGGGYEALALPVILLWQSAGNHVVLVALLTGLAGGIFGSSIILLLYHYIKKPRLYLVLAPV